MIRVVRVINIKPHPNADRLEILVLAASHSDDPNFDSNLEVVCGRHYVKDQLGLYIPSGEIIPGYVAEDMWLVGKRKAQEPYRVKSKNMRGVMSHGLFAGEVYFKDKDDPRSVQRYEGYRKLSVALRDNAFTWRYWNPAWKLGDVVEL